eukprot:6195041-Pleurochrysis_carterae.AAC.4
MSASQLHQARLQISRAGQMAADTAEAAGPPPQCGWGTARPKHAAVAAAAIVKNDAPHHPRGLLRARGDCLWRAVRAAARVPGGGLGPPTERLLQLVGLAFELLRHPLVPEPHGL